MNLSWPVVYLILYIYRCTAGFFAEVYISRVTTLGDNPTYVNTKYLSFKYFNMDSVLLAPRRLSTEITENLASIFNKLFFGNPILINIAFQSIAFIGIIALLRALSPRQRKWMLLFLFLPSFTIWSSIAGKEAIAVFALGFISSFLIKSTKKLNFPNFTTIISFIIIFLFKAQFLPSLLFIYGAIFSGHKIRQRAFFIFFIGLLTISALYVQKDQIEKLSLRITINFSTNAGYDGLAGGRSTRDIFWKEKYDIFWKSPEGMIVSLMGPTPTEALKGNTILLLGFVEGLFIVTIFFILLLSNIPRIPAFVFFSIIFSIFWLLFATYPLGIMNPGTAIRYRSSYLPLIATIIVFFLSYYSNNEWKKKH